MQTSETSQLPSRINPELQALTSIGKKIMNAVGLNC